MNIKIFVSNRLDVNSTQIPNDIFLPIVCGACFGKGVIAHNGDNTGNNISDMRDKLGEFTVQYWAWKNMDLDYYGLCHYRRFLSFAKTKYKRKAYIQMHREAFLDKKAIARYGLDNEPLITDLVSKYDAIVNEGVDIRHIYTPLGIKNTVYEHWEAHDGVFIHKEVIPILMNAIQDLFPQYYQSAIEYFNGYLHRGYNCYVLRRDIFFEMCNFQFGVIFYLKDKIPAELLVDCERTLGYMGEMMYGIFIYHLSKQNRYRIKELPLIYFEQTEIPKNQIFYFIQKILYMCRLKYEWMGLKMFPMGSFRRKFIKSVYYSIKNSCS